MSWMRQLGWKEGLSPSSLKEIDKLEAEIEKLNKEKSIKSLQFETLEAALGKKNRRYEEEKSQSSILQRELQELNEKYQELNNKYDKQQHDISFKENQFNCLQRTLESKNKSLEDVQHQVKALEESLDSTSFNTSHSSGSSSGGGGGDASFYSTRSSITNNLSPIKKFQESNSLVEDLRIKLQNAEEIIRKRDQLIEELKEDTHNASSPSTPRSSSFDFFNSPKAFANMNKSSSIVFNDDQNQRAFMSTSSQERFGSKDSITNSPTLVGGDRKLLHQIDELKETIIEKEQIIADLNSSHRLMPELEKAQLKIQELEHRVKEDECKLFNVESSRLSLEKRMKAKEEDLKLELCLSNSQCESEKKEIQVFREEINQNKLQLQTSRDVFEVEKNNMENNFAQERDSYRKKIEELSFQNVALCKIKSELEIDIQELQKQHLMEVNNIANTKEFTLQSKIDNEKEDNPVIQDKSIEVEEKISQYLSNIISKEEEIEKLRLENHNLLQSLNNLKLEVSSNKESIDSESLILILEKDISDKNDKIKSLEELLSSSSSKSASEAIRFQKRIKELEDEHEKDKNELQIQIDNTETDSISLKTSMASLQSELLSVKNEKTALHNEFIKFKENSDDQVNCIQGFGETRMKELQESLEKQVKSCESLEETIKSLNEEKEALKNMHECLLNSKEKEIETISHELETLQIRFESEVQALKDEYELEKKNIIQDNTRGFEKIELQWKDKLSNKENEMTLQFNDLSQNLESKNEELSNLNSQINDLNSEKESLLCQVKDMEASVHINSQNLKEREIALEKEIDMLRRDINEMKDMIKDKESQSQLVREENVSLKDRLNSISVGSLGNESELQSLKDELHHLKSTKLSQLQVSLLQAEERLSNLVQENDEKSKSLSIESSRNHELATKLNIQKENLSNKESAYEELDSRIQLLQESLEEEKNDKLDLSEKLNEKMRDMLVLQENFSVQILTMEEDRSEIEKEKDDLCKSNLYFNDKIESLTKENENLAHRISELNERNQKLVQENESLVEEQSQCFNVSESIKTENEKLLSDLEKIENDKSNLMVEIANLNDDIDFKIKDYENKIQELSLKVSESEEQLEFKDIQLFDAKEKLDSALQAQLNQTVDSEAQYNIKIRDLECHIYDLQESIKSLENDKKGYIRKIDSLRTDSTTQLDSILKSNQQLCELRSEYEKSLQDIESEKGSLMEELAFFKSRFHLIKNEYESLQIEFKSLQYSNDEVSKERESLLEKVISLEERSIRDEEFESENDKLKVKLSSMEKEKSSTEAQLLEKEVQLRECNVSIQDLMAENKELNHQILDFESKYDSLDEKYVVIKEENDILIQKVSETKYELESKLKKENDLFEEEKAALNNSISVSRKDMEKLNFQLTGVNNENFRLKKEIDTLQSSLCETKNDLDVQNNLTKSIKTELEEKSRLHDELAKEKDSLLKRVHDSNHSIELLIAKERTLVNSIEEFKQKLSSFSHLNEENESLKKVMVDLEMSASELKSNLDSLNLENEELKKCHDEAIADIYQIHEKEKEKIMQKLRSLETSKEDELGEWKFKVKSLLNSLKSKEKQIIQLLKTNTDLKDSFDKESQELNKQLKIYQNEETEIFPWEAEPEEYRDLTPVDLLYIFKDEKLSHRVRAELYYKAVGHLKQDIELKMDRNIELVKELGEVKRQVDHLKLKYEELPKMESELNPSSNNILKINYHESVKSEGIMTRAAKRKSINIYSENRGPQPAYPSQERGENTEVNPFKIRSLLKPATLKVTNPKKKPLNTITNQATIRNSK